MYVTLSDALGENDVRPYFTGFRIVSVIMSDRFEELHFPLFYGAQNHHLDFIFIFLGPSSIVIEARFERHSGRS